MNTINNKNSIYDKFVSRICKDYDAAINDLLSTKNSNTTEKDFLINNAYEIAHYNEIVSFFEDVVFDEFLEDDEAEKILSSDANLVKKIWNNWLNYRHPEQYNFFSYECLWDIIKYVLLQIS